MNKKKVSLIPLYIADILMFLTVFVIALPAIEYSEFLPTSTSLLCAFIVIVAMLCLLIPHYFEYKLSKEERANEENDISKNIDIIFDDLKAQRLMIANLDDRFEKYEELIYQNCDQKLNNLQEALSVQLKEALNKRDSKTQSLILDKVELKLKSLSHENTSLFGQIETLKNQLEKLKDKDLNNNTLLQRALNNSQAQDTKNLVDKFLKPQNIIEEDFIEDIEEEIETQDNEEEIVEEVESDDINTEILFEDLEEEIPQEEVKPTESDTVISVNALIGIGNKPYIRGDKAGLSMEHGIQMNHVEIGKWEIVLPSFEGELKFSILKNDEDYAQGDRIHSTKAGDNIDLNLAFPINKG